MGQRRQVIEVVARVVAALPAAGVTRVGIDGVDGSGKTCFADELALALREAGQGGDAMKPQPLIAVEDVEASGRWYQRLLGGKSGHGGAEYEQIVDTTGKMVLQLHAWDAHEHPHLGDPGRRPYGNGVLLWFQLDDFDAAVERAREMGVTILQGPRVNPNANHRELWVRDPDGYVVVLASAFGDL